MNNNKIKKFNASFYRSPKLGEIGPQLEQHELAATSKTSGLKKAKEIAKFHDYRFLEITEIC